MVCISSCRCCSRCFYIDNDLYVIVSTYIGCVSVGVFSGVVMWCGVCVFLLLLNNSNNGDNNKIWSATHSPAVLSLNLKPP